MQSLPRQNYRFDNFELDVPKRKLLRDGKPISLSPKAFDLLVVLVEHNGELLTKDDIWRLVWNEQLVEESNLTVNMSQIRKALGEKATAPRYITTVSGRGYYFTADLKEPEKSEDLFIESRSFQRVVVEEETETDEPPEKIIARASHLLPARPIAFFYRHNYAFFTAGLILAALFAAWYFVVRKNDAAPFRQISIKRLTTSGRATVAALSPDGRLYAFAEQEPDGRQSLKLGQTDGGGGEVELVAPAETNFQGIRFSPDGAFVYYSADSENSSFALYRLPFLGGVPVKIKGNLRGYITFSPDGKQFATIRATGNQSVLLAVNVDDGAEKQIAARPLNLAFIAGSPAWSPDGREIAVAAVNHEKGLNQEIFIVSTEDGAVRQLTAESWVAVRGLAWTKDADNLIATAAKRELIVDTQLWSVAAAGGAARQIVTDLNIYGGFVNLSADDRQLVAIQGQNISNIWVAPAGNLSAAKQITFDQLGKQSGWDGLGWTPDGRILYTAFAGKSETIWQMKADGSEQKQIIPEGGANNNLSLSADGRVLAFSSNRSGTYEIWLADASGANLRQVTSDGNNFNPAISPDGKFVVYNSTRDGANVLWKASTGGGEAVRLTEKAANFPRFSPDGKYIACSYDADTGKSQIAVINADGGAPVHIFDAPRSANFRLGIHWTPDGAALTYRDWNFGIWRQNLTGGAPARIEGLPQEKLYSYDWSPDGKFFTFTRGTEIRDVVLISDIK